MRTPGGLLRAQEAQQEEAALSSALAAGAVVLQQPASAATIGSSVTGVLLMVVPFNGGMDAQADVFATLRKPRSRRLLPTTNTLDSAMAAPASIGLRSPSAAIGIAATL